jgi:hypothetical protein
MHLESSRYVHLESSRYALYRRAETFLCGLDAAPDAKRRD